MSDWFDRLTGPVALDGAGALEVTPLSAEALPAVTQLEQAAHSHPWSAALLREAIEGRQKGLVAYRSGELVAHLVLLRAVDTLELLNIAVAPQCRRRGYARALLSHVIDVVAGQFESLFLEVRESNAAAVALYHRLGFDTVGRRAGYYPTDRGREDALLLSRPLGRPPRRDP